MSEPPDFDPDAPASARVYDWWLGGCDNFAADRKLGGEIERICPEVRQMARSNREFLARAVTWAARQGITQFMDLGSGFPVAAEFHHAENLPVRRPDADTHVSARAVYPRARVAYVDNDRIAASHTRALLAAPAGIAAVLADLTDPGAVLAEPELLKVIHPGLPCCVILGLVVHYMEAGPAREVTAGYIQHIAPGSCVVITTGRCDDPEMWKQVRDAYTAADLYNHTREQVTGFFGALELVPPGLVVAQGWRGGWHHARMTPPGPAYVLAGVGRKA